MIKSKQGVIGSTITWVFAVIVLAFALATLLVFATGIFIKKGPVDISRESQSFEELFLAKKLSNFLDSPFGDGNVGDLIEEDVSAKENYQQFKVLAQEFLDQNFQVGSKEPYENVWLRIYDYSETVHRDSSGKYFSYDTRKSYYGGNPQRNCDPNNENILYLEFPLKNKRVIVCATYN